MSLRSNGVHWLHRSANASSEWASGPLTLAGPRDSGTAERPVVWRTHPADAGLAVVSAGFAVPGPGAAWTRSAAGQGLWQVAVPAVAAGRVACPQQLWAGSARLARARYPARGFSHWEAALDPRNHTAEVNSFGFVFGAAFTPIAAGILAQQGESGVPLRALNITVVTMHIWGDSHSTLESINLTDRTLRWAAPSTTPVGLYESGMPGSTSPGR